MKRLFTLLCFLFLVQLGVVNAQSYPPLELSTDVVTGSTGSFVDVSVRAGMNFQNIVLLRGTLVFDTTVATYNSMVFWGLSNPNGVNFTYNGGGRLSFTWNSLISIGPTLSAGDRVFTLRFDVVGAPGTTTLITLDSVPTQKQWGNGFGWGGTNFAYGPGQINVICGQPAAAFTSTDSLLTWDFNFSGQSTTGSSYLWDFGDGNTSTQQNPTHVYASPGTRVVCVTVSDTCGTDSLCQTINVCPPPVTSFTQSANNQTITFGDQTTGGATSWLWDFGDGNTSTQQNPTHTYASTGNYTVCLTTTSACGSDSSCRSIQVSCNVPATNWTNTSNELTSTFTDITTGGATSWFWDFGDGNTSTLQNPTHTYSAPGNYTVCLTTTNVCGSDSTCYSVNVTCTAPAAAFADSTNELVVDFADLSTNGATSWLWDFGDGNTSTQQNPSHTYATPGSYTVCLTSTSICGSDSTCHTVTVTCVAPTASFTQASTARTVQFTDGSTNTPTSWAWDFGDGNTSTQQDPSHTYSSDGTFTVCLVASSICGADTVCDSVTVMGTGGLIQPPTESLRIYPVPAEKFVQIEWEGTREMKSIRLLSLLGKEVREESGLNGQAYRMPLEGISAGLYFVEVEIEGARIVRRIQVK